MTTQVYHFGLSGSIRKPGGGIVVLGILSIGIFYASRSAVVTRFWLLARRSLKRSVAFHRDDAVGDHEMRRYRAVDIEDAPADSLPMENVL